MNRRARVVFASEYVIFGTEHFSSLDNLDMRCILYLDHLEERNYEFCR
jgi:hypothetical protein